MDSNWLAWRTRRKVNRTEVVTTAQAMYASLVKERLSPGLRDLGFKGSSGRYSLADAEPFALLGLQKSAYSDAAEVGTAQGSVDTQPVRIRPRWKDVQHAESVPDRVPQ